jgi:hypothetical protein
MVAAGLEVRPESFQTRKAVTQHLFRKEKGGLEDPPLIA